MHGLPAARVAVGLKRRSQSELPAPLPLPFSRAGSPGTVGTARCPSRSAAAGLGAAGATTSVRRLARRGGCWRAAGSLATAPAVSLQHLWPMRGGLVPRITYCVTLSPHCPAPGPGYLATTLTHHRAGAPVLAFLSSPNLKGPGTPTATRRPRHRRGWDAAGRHPSRAPDSLAVAQTALPRCERCRDARPGPPNLKGPGFPAAIRRPLRRRGWDAAGRHPSRAPGSLAVALTALPHCRAPGGMPGSTWRAARRARSIRRAALRAPLLVTPARTRCCMTGRTAGAPTGDAGADSVLHGGPHCGRTCW